jgi:hypothetical protein
MKRKELNIQSEQVDELLSKIPNWITRWGISLIFLILFFVILISNYITFPDVIKGKIVILNTNINRISCMLEIQKEKAYRIHTGNDAILKFERYPFQKFGIVKTQIINISDSTIHGYLLCTIKLSKQLKTDQNISIVIKNNMKADCEIIVDKKSILKRLSDYIIDNQN